MHLYIKNMVCDRCISAVRHELEKLNLNPVSIQLGEAEINEPTEKQLMQLKQNLAASGFELLDDSRKKLIEKIKNIVIEQIHYTDAYNKHNFSEILSHKLLKD